MTTRKKNCSQIQLYQISTPCTMMMVILHKETVNTPLHIARAQIDEISKRKGGGCKLNVELYSRTAAMTPFMARP